MMYILEARDQRYADSGILWREWIQISRQSTMEQILNEIRTERSLLRLAIDESLYRIKRVP
jgi:hypothetical protein